MSTPFELPVVEGDSGPRADASRNRARILETGKVLVVCGAAIGLMFGFGPLFFSVVGIYLKPMTVAFGWGRSDARDSWRRHPGWPGGGRFPGRDG